MRLWWLLMGVLALLGSATGCATKKIGVEPSQRLDPAEVMRPSAEEPRYEDDQGFKGLEVSLNDHIEDYRRRVTSYPPSIRFGAKQVLSADYVQALVGLRDHLKNSRDPANVDAYLREKFSCYEVQGDGRWGQAFITSYFDPLIPASRTPTTKLFRPIYMLPHDMVLIRLDEFRQSFPHWSLFVSEQKSATPLARGRLSVRSGAKDILPYYSRSELDSLGLLRGQGHEIAYADPIDVFMMQIQGSGTLRFANGETIRVGYAAQNGFPYVAIGKFLKERIAPDEISLQSIERVLRAMPPDESQAILNQNPSYVFFEILNSQPRTTLGTIVRPGRTIATDRTYFPKGTLAFVRFEKPVFESAQAEKPSSWVSTSRLVIDQDTGGAIRGTGRLDLYWGHGDEAKQAAGVMKQWGKLCYLVPR